MVSFHQNIHPASQIYLRYLHGTITIVFIINSSVKLAKFYFSSTVITEVGLFDCVIYSSAGPDHWPRRPAEEKIACTNSLVVPIIILEKWRLARLMVNTKVLVLGGYLTYLRHRTICFHWNNTIRHILESHHPPSGSNPVIMSVWFYPGGRKIHLIPSITEIQSQMWHHCVQYTRRHHMSLIAHCQHGFCQRLLIWAWYLFFRWSALQAV